MNYCFLKNSWIFHGIVIKQPDSQGLHLRYPRYGEDPDTGWSRGTQILGAWHSYLAGVGKNALFISNSMAWGRLVIK